MNNSDSPAMPYKADINERVKAQALGAGIPYVRAQYAGLSKREHFAIEIYAGMMSCCDESGEFTGLNCPKLAVYQADALLKALESDNEH